MSKSEFIRKYRKLTNAEKSALRAYYEDIYKGAVFANTYALAETALLWMREADTKSA